MKVTRKHSPGIKLEGFNQDLTFEELEILELAMYSFGFLLPMNTTITGEEWIKTITNTYESSERINRFIEVIKKANS